MNITKLVRSNSLLTYISVAVVAALLVGSLTIMQANATQPQDLQVDSVQDTYLVLSWTHDTSEDGWRLEKSTSQNSNYSLVVAGRYPSYASGLTQASVSSRNLDPGTTYYYRLCSWSGNSSSACPTNSPSVSARTLGGTINSIPAFTNLRLISTTDNVVILDWDAATDHNVGGYKVTRQWLGDTPAPDSTPLTGEMPVLTIAQVRGTRNTGLSDYVPAYNSSGDNNKYLYNLYATSDNGSLESLASTIEVTVPVIAAFQPSSPQNFKLKNSWSYQRGFEPVIRGNWDDINRAPAYLMQWRELNQSYPTDVDADRNKINTEKNGPNMYFADNRGDWSATISTYKDARSVGRIDQRSNGGNKLDANTDYYVRVGSCATSACDIDEVVFGSEQSINTGNNPYGSN